MVATFEILPGLPPYGASAIPFPPDGPRSFSEGLVIRFVTNTGDSWIGNFQRGAFSLDRVLLHPDGQHIIVAAGGDGYIINPVDRTMSGSFGPVTYLEQVPALAMILAADLTCFHAFRAGGTGWQSNRVSWDGIRNIVINGTALIGEVYSPLDDSWHPFTLDLITGKSENAIYEEQIAKFVPVVRKSD